MISKGTRIKLSEFSIRDRLEKEDLKLPVSSSILFDLRISFYEHVRFNMEFAIDKYQFRPSFYFSNLIDVCQDLKMEKGKTICYTEYFIVELEDAIQNREIEVIDSNYSLQSNKEILDIDAFKNELMDLNENYQQGLLTEKEVISKMIGLNSIYCIKQKKWDNIVKSNYFLGGLATN